MCGIAGEITCHGVIGPENIANLVSRLAHRGPDNQSIYKSTDGQCVLGHARLSIIDLSTAANQPMVDSLTGNIIVFNGEIYNFLQIRKYLESQGDIFQTQSDTEVVLVLYRRHGIECLQHIRGMFAFAIWDTNKKSLLIARDRLGKKPLNYVITKNCLIFSSEIDPLSRHPKVSPEIDQKALNFYLQLQYVPSPWTIYKQIKKLPPAHYAVFDHRGLKIKKYWDLNYQNTIMISEEEALDGLEEKLFEAVRLRMISDVPLGALLSGGVDSSLVVAVMAKLCEEPVKTFSIGFQSAQHNELPFAQQTSDYYKTEHYPEIVTGDIEYLIPKLVKHYGEPFADSSAVPSFYVSQTARRHVAVVLNGDGGDELLGGYPRYELSGKKIIVGKLLGRLAPPEILATIAPSSRNAPPQKIITRALRKLLRDFTNPELRSMLMYSQSWNDPERAELLGIDSDPTLLRNWRMELLRGAMEQADNPIDRMLWMDNRTYLPGDLLVKMDIASMHCGLETRSPLLDQEVIEFCSTLPVELKVKDGTGKYLLKKLAERYFPANFVHRKKMGFSIPKAEWLRGPLRENLKEILRDQSAITPLNNRVIDKTITEFFAGQNNHASRLWILFMYAQWRRYRYAEDVI
jgi:asparagine synthase (glutamine-hydrolysing)